MKFNKDDYWIGRVNDQIKSLFDYTEMRLKDIKDNADHMGVDPEDLKKAFTGIAKSFDYLKYVIDNFDMKIGKAIEKPKEQLKNL